MNNNTIKYTKKLLNYNNYFNKNKRELFLIYKNFNDKLMTIIKNTSINELLKKNTQRFKWKAINLDKPIIYYEYNKENLTIDEFTELFNQYKIDFSKIKHIDITKYILNINPEIINVLNFVHYVRYISLDIKLWIQNNINTCYKYDFQHLELYYFFSDSEYNSDSSKQKQFNDKIYNIYIITKWIYDINPIYKIKYYFFDTPCKKTLPDKIVHKDIIDKFNLVEKNLSSQNISSGFTSINEKKGYREIIIWRREEMYLVITHELFHYLLLDTKFLNEDKYASNTPLINIINYKISGNTQFPLLINETITEILSNFFYIMFLSIIQNNDIIQKFNKFKIMYQNELIFNWYQFVKIMKFFDINSFNSELLQNKFNQTTSVFSYFILKPILSTEFCNIIFPFPYINKLFNNNYEECNIYKCNYIVNFITKKMINLKINEINLALKNIEIKEDTLKRSLYSISDEFLNL